MEGELMATKKKQYSIYINERIYDKLKSNADKNYRSVNAELEMLINKQYGRKPKETN